MKLLLLALSASIILCGCCACPKSPPEALNPVSKPALKPFKAGHVSWSSRAYPLSDTPASRGREYDLTCAETGAIVASVTAYNGEVHTWGGDGREFGYYLQVDAAKAKAESIVNGGGEFGLTWRTCEAKQ